MYVHIADNSQGAGRTIGQMDGEMPAERVWVEGSTRNVERHPNLTVQPSVNERNRFFLSGGNELWEGREWMTCANFRHNSLLLRL
jgi:hypothetical protein